VFEIAKEPTSKAPEINCSGLKHLKLRLYGSHNGGGNIGAVMNDTFFSLKNRFPTVTLLELSCVFLKDYAGRDVTFTALKQAVFSNCFFPLRMLPAELDYLSLKQCFIDRNESQVSFTALTSLDYTFQSVKVHELDEKVADKINPEEYPQVLPRAGNSEAVKALFKDFDYLNFHDLVSHISAPEKLKQLKINSAFIHHRHVLSTECKNRIVKEEDLLGFCNLEVLHLQCDLEHNNGDKFDFLIEFTGTQFFAVVKDSLKKFSSYKLRFDPEKYLKNEDGAGLNPDSFALLNKLEYVSLMLKFDPVGDTRGLFDVLKKKNIWKCSIDLCNDVRFSDWVTIMHLFLNHFSDFSMIS